jgi:hypothetical protein
MGSLTQMDAAIDAPHEAGASQILRLLDQTVSEKISQE